MQSCARLPARLQATACSGILDTRRGMYMGRRQSTSLNNSKQQRSAAGLGAQLPGRQRTVTALAARRAAAAAVAAAPAAAASVWLQPELVFSLSTYCIVPVYLLMVLFPQRKLTRIVVDSPVLPIALALAYAVLMWQAWQEGLAQQLAAVVRACHPFPDVHALAGLFANHTMTALAWLHLLLLDFIQAKSVLMDGLTNQVPTRHSVMLCFMFGPLGLLSHMITKAAVTAVRRRKKH